MNLFKKATDKSDNKRAIPVIEMYGKRYVMIETGDSKESILETHSNYVKDGYDVFFMEYGINIKNNSIHLCLFQKVTPWSNVKLNPIFRDIVCSEGLIHKDKVHFFQQY